MSQNNEMAAMLVSQTNPVGVELFSYVPINLHRYWPSAPRSRVLARLVSLAQIGELARRLDSPGLVDFAIGLVKSVFNLPDGQVMFFEEFE